MVYPFFLFSYFWCTGPRFHGHGTRDGSAGLWPSVFNVATKASITTNATCGERGREEFCRLADHGKGRCGVCDSNSPDPNKRHPIENAIDGTNRWWQSPTLHSGPEYERVAVILDLKQESNFNILIFVILNLRIDLGSIIIIHFSVHFIHFSVILVQKEKNLSLKSHSFML